MFPISNSHRCPLKIVQNFKMAAHTRSQLPLLSARRTIFFLILLSARKTRASLDIDTIHQLNFPVELLSLDKYLKNISIMHDNYIESSCIKERKKLHLTLWKCTLDLNYLNQKFKKFFSHSFYLLNLAVEAFHSRFTLILLGDRCCFSPPCIKMLKAFFTTSSFILFRRLKSPYLVNIVMYLVPFPH